MSELSAGVILTGIGFMLLLTFISWALAHVAKRLPDRIPRIAKILVCGTLVQGMIIGVGVGGALAAETNFLDWLQARPMRFYFLIPGLLALGCLAAWWVLRHRDPNVNVEVFE